MRELRFFLAAVGIVLLFALPVSLWAACGGTGNALVVASPYAAADLNDCLAVASGLTGEVTITIPDGAPTWTSAVTVSMRTGWDAVTKLIIQGQTACTLQNVVLKNGITIQVPTACNTSITNGVINLDTKNGKAVSVLNLQFNGSSGFTVQGDSKAVRLGYIFMNQVTPSGQGSRLVWINPSKYGAGEYLKGVADHWFVDRPAYATIFHARAQPSVDGGNGEFMRAHGAGTDDAFYIESSKLYKTSLMYWTDCEGGGRLVLRNNQIYNGYLSTHDAVIAGFRGCRKFEVYGNDFINSAGVYPCPQIQIRGGLSFIYDNTFQGTMGCGAPENRSNQYEIYRVNHLGDNGWPTACASDSGNMILNTTSNYPQTCASGTGCVKTDGSTVSPSGYPCRDQVGWEQAADGSMSVNLPSLLWNNKSCDTSPCTPINYIDPVSGASGYMTSGTDFCSDASSRGTKPAACNGVSSDYYSALAYPHPLITAGGGGSTKSFTIGGGTKTLTIGGGSKTISW